MIYIRIRTQRAFRGGIMLLQHIQVLPKEEKKRKDELFLNSRLTGLFTIIYPTLSHILFIQYRNVLVTLFTSISYQKKNCLRKILTQTKKESKIKDIITITKISSLIQTRAFRPAERGGGVNGAVTPGPGPGTTYHC